MHACTEERGITQPLHQGGLSTVCMHAQRREGSHNHFTKEGWVSYVGMHRGGREGGANYLQVVTKHTLEDQVGLSISIVGLASQCGIQLASLKDICFLFQTQVSANFLAIFKLTISILGVLRRERIPRPTDPHTGQCVISGIGIGRSGMSGIGSSNSSKSNKSSSNVTPAVSGIPTASGRGAKSEVAHL